jgi:transposase
MTGTRRQYTSEFKREAIRLYESSGKSVRQIEVDLDITPGLLNKWRGGQRTQGQQAFVGSGHQTELEAELRRVKRENEILRQERDILKKAIQVLGRDGR